MTETELYDTTGPKGPSMTRRNVLKSLGVAGAAGATGTAPNGAVGDADAIACGGVCIGLGLAAAAGVGYLVHEAADHYLGKDNYGELDGTEETNDLHRELRTRLIETRAANEDVLTTANNRVQDARNVAWPAAKMEAVKARNNEETEQAAIDAAVAEVDNHYSTIQKNLANRFIEVVNSWTNIFDLHESDSTLSGSPVIKVRWIHEGGDDVVADPSHMSGSEYTVSLVDGSSYTCKQIETPQIQTPGYTSGWIKATWTPDNGFSYTKETNVAETYLGQELDPVNSGTVEEWFLDGSWSSAWSAIVDDHSQMVSNVHTFVTTLYQTTEPGEIEPSNWLDASTLASELSTDYDSTGYHAYAAAEAAVAGIPGNMENAMRVTWEESGVTVSGSIWTEWAPAASESTTETSTATATATETSTATDSGTTEAGTEAFEVGQLYDPANTNKLVLMSYEYGGEAWIPESDVWVRDDSGSWTQDTSVTSADGWTALEGEKLQVGYGELSQPFTIESAVNSNTGDTISVVTTESKNHQTSGVDVTEEQMQELLDLAEQMRSNDSPGGAAGGFDPSQFAWGPIPGVGVLGGAATLAAGFIAWAGTR